MRHVGQVLLSLCLHSFSVVDVSETWKEQEPSRNALKEGIQLVHHHVIGLTGVEGPCYEDVVHDGFWFKPELEGPVGQGLDAGHVLAVEEDGCSVHTTLLLWKLGMESDSVQEFSDGALSI